MSELQAGEGRIRIGVDIGGTFTDIVVTTRDSRVFIDKVSTTPDSPERAVIEGVKGILVRLGLAPSAVTEVVQGTTVGSNTILQRCGAVTGLITTAGFRDVLEIGRIRTPEMFNVSWEKPEPLAPRRYRREVRERMAFDGAIVTALDEEEVAKVAADLVAEGVQSIAICFLNSYANTAHEQIAARVIREKFPDIHVTASYEVLPELKEYERTSTTVVNAYLLREMATYLRKLSSGLREIGIHAPLQVMASNGGTMGAKMAAANPVYAVASGPAGGIVGAAAVGKDLDGGNLIVFDMGGTTAKASIIEDGKPSLVTEYEFRDGISSPSRFIKGGGYMLKVPAVDIAEVGAGGGSIASIDSGGLLLVGPRSVGSDPGPACYGRGNDIPTVTDANMCLGYLNPTALAGGTLGIDVGKAKTAVESHIGRHLSLGVEDAAHGIRQIANVNMARAIRSVTIERGRDPRDMTLVAIGGGGPLHAADLASLLGIKRVVIPIVSGVFSAAGMLSADVEHNFVRFVLRPLADTKLDWLRGEMDAMAEEGRQTLLEEGYEGSSVEFRFFIDLRYEGQSSELTIPIDANALGAGFNEIVEKAFGSTYHATYGYSTEEPVEIAALRLTAVGRSEERFKFADAKVDSDAVKGLHGTRMVWFDRGGPAIEVTLVGRGDVGPETKTGPAIIESYDTTIVVPPGSQYRADSVGNIVIEIGSQTEEHNNAN